MLALIMAGGLGTRFWPKSRKKLPKHLLRVFGEKTLIQSTVERLSPVIKNDDIYVVSTREQITEIRKQLPMLPAANFIVEPKGKNTAPCIGLAALFMQQRASDEIMVVLPADHQIVDRDVFQKTLQAGAKVARDSDQIITIGIEPYYPATGYGYIQVHDEVRCIDGLTLSQIKTFAEKPDLETAKRFLHSGDFLWNSGIFIWRISKILAELEENLPQLYDGLMEIKSVLGTPKQEETIDRVYCQIRSVSIDYGVMESARNVHVMKGQFGWNDLGSWDEIYKLSTKDEQGNVLLGNHLTRNTKGCFVDAPGKCVALLGVENLIIVDTGDALLVCPRELSQDVKDIVELAKRKKLEQYI